ncbi:MAG: hypothetical protein KJO07_02205, partial [Deltaproteobacteria bacterium]|nr:hypothetical protein [Deltaproteobacteria bacterium]
MRWLVCALLMAAGCGSPSKSQTPAPQRRSTNVIDAPKPSKRPRPAAVPAKTKVMELSVRGLYVSGALAKKDVNRALDTALAQLGDCDGRLSDWRSVVRGSVSMRVAATGAVERVSLPTAIDGLLGECVRNVLEPMLFPKQTRRTRVSFELEVMPTSLDDHEIAMLDKCDDLYRVCIERIYSRTVPKDDVLAALLEVHFGGPCNRAERRERYSVSLRFNQDGTFRDLKVRIRSGRKETQACLSNELARAQVSGPVSRSYASASFTLVLEPASTAPFDAAPAHVRLG